MSDIRVVASTTPTRKTANDGFISPRALRDGTLVSIPWYDALALEGRVFVAQNGDETTPLTFLALAANRPDAWIRVATSTIVIPLSCTVTIEAGAGTVTEIDLRTAQNDIGNGTSTAASVGPLASKTSAPIASTSTVRHLATADTTAGTNEVTVWRKTLPFAMATTEGNEFPTFDITREMMGYPVLVGPASIMLYISATTTQATGFVTWKWAEIPSNTVE